MLWKRGGAQADRVQQSCRGGRGCASTKHEASGVRQNRELTITVILTVTVIDSLIAVAFAMTSSPATITTHDIAGSALSVVCTRLCSSCIR